MSASSKKGGKLTALIGYRLKITLNDSRNLIGQLLAHDKHMNLVIAECEEFRRVKSKKGKVDEDEPEEEMKRTLGLVILRGETIVSLSVEGPPPSTDDSNGPQLGAGPGFGAPAGRGMGLGAPTMRSAPAGMPPQNFPPPPGMMPPGMPGMPPMGFAPPPGFQGR